jgi:hypothetical protein
LSEWKLVAEKDRTLVMTVERFFIFISRLHLVSLCTANFLDIRYPSIVNQ